MNRLNACVASTEAAGLIHEHRDRVLSYCGQGGSGPNTDVWVRLPEHIARLGCISAEPGIYGQGYGAGSPTNDSEYSAIWANTAVDYANA